MTFSLVTTQAPQASWLNGGTDGTGRQYWLSATQHVPNGPRIAAAVAGLAAGEFGTIWADSSGSIFVVRRADDGSTANILDWNPHAVWHEATEQILCGGRRGTIKLIGYADLPGDWREMPMPALLGRNVSGTVHWYGNTAQDGAGNVYYGTTEAPSQTWRFNPATGVWTQLANTPAYSQLGSVMEWFPEANSGAGGLVKCLPLGTGTGRLILLSADETSWSTLASGFGNGQHALMRHHPSHARLLIVGGSSSLRAATLMDAAGTATSVTDVPQDVLMSGGSWIIAHPSGCWLVRAYDAGGDDHVYAAWPNAALDGVTWQDLGTSPDNALTNTTAALDSTRGAIYIVAQSGLYAWKLPAVSDPSGTIPVGRADEAAAALALLPVQILAVGLAAEADTSLALSAGASSPVGAALEADAAIALLPVQARPVGVALEADVALELATGAVGVVGLAAEADQALALLPVQLLPVGLALEAGIALALNSGTSGDVGLAWETGQSFALAPVQLLPAGLASETDIAFALLDGSIVTVPADRVWRVPAENRIHTVPAEARIYRIRP